MSRHSAGSSPHEYSVPEWVSIPQRVERHAARAPDAVAVTFEGASLTYGELNRRANQVAHRLRSLGVGPESRVAIGLDRSLEMVVGLLGILKSGGAYLPLDMTYPGDRLEFMLTDAQPAVVLTSSAHQGGLPVGQGATLLLDADWADFAFQPTDDPEPVLQPDNLAYVIYTSGSTGRPKGCQVTHANVARLFDATHDWFHFGPSDVWTFFHSHAFDFSVWEIWGALAYGGRLVVVPHMVTRSPELLHALLVREGVTVLNQTPSAFRGLIHADLASSAAPDALALRYIIFGGEALELRMLRPWFDRHGDARPKMVNMYGITETTVHVTYRPIVKDDLDRNAGSVIGASIPDLRVFVLDEAGTPVAPGQVGEIHVAGAGVCRGYLNRPELTAERFLDWQSPAGETLRMYRTGDLARPTLDGDLEYLGRIDHQVKIRGFRIETGEIESVLAQHPGVRECTVIARTDRPGTEPRLVAYVVPRGVAPSPGALRGHLAGKLPDYMIPTAFVSIDALPLTGNGKLDRRALPAPARSRPDTGPAFEPPRDPLEQSLCDLFGELLAIDTVGRDDNFFELGGDSVLAAGLIERVRRDVSIDPGGVYSGLQTLALFQHPTPAELAASISGRREGTIANRRLGGAGRQSGTLTEPIAIVAMAGRFPGAPDVESFWQSLCEGRDSITEFAPGELDPSVGAAALEDPAYVRARGIIDGVEMFDAAFFGFGPREAELMDPQHRVFLELCWECMERAGHAPGAADGLVGVFAGMFNASYFQHHVAAHPDLVEKVGAFQVMLNNEKDFIATRVAHKLNLTGPAISVHTACSTSLVAISQAIDSLHAGHCDMALAGGITVTCPPRSGYHYQEGAMLSPDGRTRTFDAEAKGTVFSDGGAVVLLKRLSDAVADGNPVYAVIRGAAVNNDGGVGKASFTAPSSEGQAAVIAMAHARSGVDPRSIGYVEAHGTATPLGDPIEIEGLTRAFRRATRDVGFCRIGSVKSNVGHLVIAAGAAGVIKTALALKEGTIPPSLHHQTPNPRIDFAGSPFTVNTTLSRWTSGALPRRAGVSSFGVGGTNAHVVMEEAPALPASSPSSGPQLLVLSARSPNAVARAATQLADHLHAHPEDNLADVAWTLARGRKALPHRISIVAGSSGEAIEQLRGPEIAAVAARSRPARQREVVFLFPGQGATYPGMGRGLYASEPVFRTAVDQCADILRDSLGFDLRERAFADDPEALLPTSVMQPATFALEYALARLWLHHGVEPAAMIGHSVGEFVAATLAGVFSLADALRLVARRGTLMQAQPAGGMLSVRLPLEELQALMPGDLSLAAENAPGACVVSGPHESIAALRSRLDADGVACRALRTSHAFHSWMMDPVLPAFLAEVEGLTLSAPALRIVSTSTGDWLDSTTATSGEYWGQHLRQPVRFAESLRRVLDAPGRVLLEVGPRATLCSFSRQHPDAKKHQTAAIPTLSDNPELEATLFRVAAGQLWTQGVPLDPATFDQRPVRRRIRLPTYPFERQRFWVDATPAARAGLDRPVPSVERAPQEANPVREAPSDVLGEAAVLPPQALLFEQLAGLFEDTSGIAIGSEDASTSFIELGYDSLMLTQLAAQLQRKFAARITLRQLMGECANLAALSAVVQSQLPVEASASPPRPEAATTPPAVAHDAPPFANSTQPPAGHRGSPEGDAAGTAPDPACADETSMAQPQAGEDGSLPFPPGLLATMDACRPITPGARLGRDPQGDPAWFLADPARPGKYLKVGT